MVDRGASILDIKHGKLLDLSDGEFPAVVYGIEIEGNSSFVIEGPGTFFGIILEGSLEFQDATINRRASPLQYFSVPILKRLVMSGKSRGFGVFVPDYIGLSTIGGPVEHRGRLKYIDGCSDTLLISPPMRGDPCFNLLHFPPEIDQTSHTHPSLRAGLIHTGKGYCRTENRTEVLEAGKIFILEPDAIHAFSTIGTEGMTLTVFHPDSDFGPTDEEHPMLNRTIVEGVSAKHLDDIRTKEL